MAPLSLVIGNLCRYPRHVLLTSECGVDPGLRVIPIPGAKNPDAAELR